MVMRRLVTGLIAAAVGRTALAQDQRVHEYWPNIQYDPALSTFQATRGYGPGERIFPDRVSVPR